MWNAKDSCSVGTNSQIVKFPQIYGICRAILTPVLSSTTSVEWIHPSDLVLNKFLDVDALNPDDDYVLPHQRLWTFDVLVCPLSVTECFLLQLLVCGTVFHHTSLLPPSLFIFCCQSLKSHLFSLSYPAF